MAWQHQLKARWQALAVREQRGLGLAAALVAVALVWSVALAPAVRTLQSADAQNAQLSSTAEHMQLLQARATQLQAQPLAVNDDTLAALMATTTALGKAASLQVMGEQIPVTLRRVSAPSLAAWFGPQGGVALIPAEAHLRREAGSAEALWSGTLVFYLPGSTQAKP
jgi:general secretion pathway protein M